MIGNERNRATIRRDQGIEAAPAQVDEGRGRHERLIRRGIAAAFVICMVVFSAIPMSIGLRGHSNKDYSLWYQVGVALRQGLELYPDPSGGRLFPFMYPPSAAPILGFLSLVGQHGTTLVLILGHSAAWIGAIGLSVWLAIGGKPGRRGEGPAGVVWRQHPLLLVGPSLCIIALIHNTYLLGQPNLALLTLLLGAFACLRLGREAWAGVLVATAAAIKAFPILALGYFLYRRHWRASAATVAALAVWLLVVPLPFRTPAQAVRDVSVWARGMVFTYNTHGIAQRPYRSFSYKNQSIMALAHRLLRDVPADGERAISAHVAKLRQERAAAGLPMPPPGSGMIDLHAMLTSPPRAPDVELRYADVEPALRRAWRVNVASLDFRTVTAVTLAAMLGLSLFVVAVLPPRGARTARSDAIEFALVTLLIVMFSPLSFNYAYVWLIYPLTVALHLVLNEPSRGRIRTLELAWIAAVFAIPGLAVVAPVSAQAYGNLFVPAVLLVVGLGLRLGATRRVDEFRGAMALVHGRGRPAGLGRSAAR
ncbi:MAG: glycosyltransferase family 87 protein [Isosphaeraceae bacterium]